MQALLLASGLPQFLWEEAMKHMTWLWNQTPTHAHDGETLYEMKNNKKPHLKSLVLQHTLMSLCSPLNL